MSGDAGNTLAGILVLIAVVSALVSSACSLILIRRLRRTGNSSPAPPERIRGTRGASARQEPREVLTRWNVPYFTGDRYDTPGSSRDSGDAGGCE